MSVYETFHSPLARAMADFVSFKRMQGYDYTDQARNLSYFDRFLVEDTQQSSDRLLTLETMERYVATTAHLTDDSRMTRLAAPRQFSRYLQARNPASAIFPERILPRHRRTIRFFPITPEQVVDLMAATDICLRSGGIRVHSIGVLIGLLYSTGLRIGEALSLTVADIDVDRSTLHVVRGKFGKERLVPMSRSTLTELTGYLTAREPHMGNSRSSPLFIGSYDTALTYGQAHYWFGRLCRHCAIQGDPPPRLHDLRHNYACQVLAHWRRADMDINALLPVLTTAMGHVRIFDTQIYLHIDAVALQNAATAFKSYITTQQGFEQ
ncbi:MAG: tyrosine-type recombinase/integrase [Lentisphaeria bacterium]|nr:tyrosine-type recombinase/integrase [Lentisphaeria bacterium]